MKKRAYSAELSVMQIEMRMSPKSIRAHLAASSTRGEPADRSGRVPKSHERAQQALLVDLRMAKAQTSEAFVAVVALAASELELLPVAEHSSSIREVSLVQPGLMRKHCVAL